MSDARSIINKVKNLKTNSESVSMKKNKGTVTGSLIGMGAGLLYGLTKSYNLISSAIVGAVIGGLIAHLVIPSDITEEDDDE